MAQSQKIDSKLWQNYKIDRSQTDQWQIIHQAIGIDAQRITRLHASRHVMKGQVGLANVKAEGGAQSAEHSEVS